MAVASVVAGGGAAVVVSVAVADVVCGAFVVVVSGALVYSRCFSVFLLSHFLCLLRE